MTRGDMVAEQLTSCGIEYVIWLPESESRWMYDAIQQSGMRLVQVCHEEEAMGIYAGLAIGGKTAVVIIQNTGMFHSIDALRGMVINHQLPMLMLVGYRGYHNFVAGKRPFDSAAVFTEPILDALGIKHYILDKDEDVENIGIAYREAAATNKPVAVLVGREA